MIIKFRTCLSKARFIWKFDWFSSVVGVDVMGCSGRESSHDDDVFCFPEWCSESIINFFKSILTDEKNCKMLQL